MSKTEKDLDWKRAAMSKRANLLIDQFRLFRNAFDDYVQAMNDDDVDRITDHLNEEVQKLQQYCKGCIDRYEAKVRDEPFTFNE